ncbi:MAG: alkaline phosphatase family protein [Bacilli bacterium]|nr:alkaline phosphatase family protein [Bacilli bacterium]
MNKANYKNSIVNLSNSILNHFGAEPFHSTIPEVDKFLEGKKKVVLFLFDGMGRYVIEKHLPENSFLRKHTFHYMTSTFPPTTVAATNGLLSGKFPSETGWLGWSQYFESIDKTVKMFSNKDDETGDKIPGPHLGDTYCGYEKITDIINRVNNKKMADMTQGTAVDTTHYWNRHLKAFIKHNYKLVNELGDESFVYAYWTDPDHEMHGEGVTAKSVHKIILKINKYIEKFSQKNPDVTTLVIADHGLIDVKNIDIWKDKEIQDCLLRNISLEGRCANFFIKPEKKEEFTKIFKEKYGEHYNLYTKEEVIEMGLFGDTKPNEFVSKFIGDYVGIATDGYMLKKEEDPFSHKAHHAGSTLDELIISIIGVN